MVKINLFHYLIVTLRFIDYELSSDLCRSTARLRIEVLLPEFFVTLRVSIFEVLVKHVQILAVT